MTNEQKIIRNMKAIRTERKARKNKSKSGAKLQSFKRLLQKEKINSLKWANHYKNFEND